MAGSLKITKIEKYDEQIDNNNRKIVDNIKLLVLFGTLIAFSTNNGLESEAEELIMGGSVLFGTINLISMVKSICKNYELKEKRKSLEDEDRQKWFCNT